MKSPRKILSVTLQYTGPESELEAEAARYAAPIANVPGLLWKLWMANSDTCTVGGVYLFENEAALQRYVDGPIAARFNNRPGFQKLSMKVFDVMEGPSRKTRAPLDLEAEAPDGFPMF